MIVSPCDGASKPARKDKRRKHERCARPGCGAFADAGLAVREPAGLCLRAALCRRPQRAWAFLRMHYLDEGPKDAPIVLMLHGNWT